MRPILLGFVLLLASWSQAANVSAPHVELTYDGIDAAHAQAIANTLSAAREVYVDDFGFDMPQTILADVKCAAGNPTRLWTDGNDHVFLTIPDPAKLDPPSKSGVFNLYGMCHELGHIAIYRIVEPHPDWLAVPTPACAEGWAHFTGSVVVDRLYETKGPSLWPDSYDYREDGTARLNRSLAGKSASDVDRGADLWRKLEAIVGRKGLRALFEAWQNASVEPGKCVEGLTAASVAAMPQKKAELEAWWKSAGPIFIEQLQASGFKAQTIDKSKLSGSPVKLELDDNTSDGMRSIAGGGHARAFDVPPGEGDWYLTAVSVFGSRYGRPQNSSNFDLAVCDADNKPIKQWSKPFSLFPYGKDGRWVRIELPPTRVPRTFNICLNFRPTATNGVYVNFDSSRRGQSRVAIPGQAGEAFEPGEWMIRVELDQAKGANALTGK